MNMNGPHRLTLLSLLVCCLSSCSSLEKATPPAAGAVSGIDPEASALLEQGKNAEAAGKTKAALKCYKKVANKHAYAVSAPEAKFRIASLLDQKGELLDSFTAYDSFIQRYPGSHLYSQALERQSVVAHAAAEGHITNNFMGLKSRVDRAKATEMLATVKRNAPRSAAASKAQFAIGQVWENAGNAGRAVAAYEEILDDYPHSPQASEAQYRIAEIFYNQSVGGNRNPANLDKADDAYHDLVQRYPNSDRAADSKQKIQTIAGLAIKRDYDVAEFHYKKKHYESASFYYKQVIKKAPHGELKNKANERLSQINALTS